MTDPSGNGNGSGAAPGLTERAKERARELAQRGKVLAGQGKDKAVDLGGQVLEQTQAHPYPALAAAFGIGYALGGGLSSPTTGRLLSLGLKLAAIPAVQLVLLDVAEAALDQALAQGRKITAPAPAPEAAAGTPQA